MNQQIEEFCYIILIITFTSALPVTVKKVQFVQESLVPYKHTYHLHAKHISYVKFYCCYFETYNYKYNIANYNNLLQTFIHTSQHIHSAMLISFFTCINEQSLLQLVPLKSGVHETYSQHILRLRLKFVAHFKVDFSIDLILINLINLPFIMIQVFSSSLTRISNSYSL